MEQRTFGNTGLSVSILGFGGAEIGFSETAQDQVDLILNTALDAGINVFDTAECYRDSEQKLGKALARRRDEFHLFTKCGHNSGFDEYQDWDPKMLALSIDRSLDRLQTDRVELIQLHSCSAEQLAQGDVIEVLQRAKEAGKTRFIGYSGDREDAVYAIRLGVFDALQTSVNIADQECIELTLPLAKEAGMGVIAKRPIANAAWKIEEEPIDQYPHEYWKRLQVLQYPELLKTDRAFGAALHFTLSQQIHTAIVGTQNPDRIRSNVEVAGRSVNMEQVESIRSRWQGIAPEDWKGMG